MNFKHNCQRQDYFAEKLKKIKKCNFHQFFFFFAYVVNFYDIWRIIHYYNTIHIKIIKNTKKNSDNLLYFLIFLRIFFWKTEKYMYTISSL